MLTKETHVVAGSTFGGALLFFKETFLSTRHLIRIFHLADALFQKTQFVPLSPALAFPMVHCLFPQLPIHCEQPQDSCRSYWRH